MMSNNRLNMAFVKASVEGLPDDTFFGSLMNHAYNRGRAVQAGVIDRDRQPTELAFKLYLTLNLHEQKGRWYFWELKVNGLKISSEDLDQIVTSLGT